MEAFMGKLSDVCLLVVVCVYLLEYFNWTALMPVLWLIPPSIPLRSSSCRSLGTGSEHNSAATSSCCLHYSYIGFLLKSGDCENMSLPLCFRSVQSNLMVISCVEMFFLCSSIVTAPVTSSCDARSPKKKKNPYNPNKLAQESQSSRSQIIIMSSKLCVLCVQCSIISFFCHYFFFILWFNSHVLWFNRHAGWLTWLLSMWL